MADNMNEAFDQHVRIPKIEVINGERTCFKAYKFQFGNIISS